MRRARVGACPVRRGVSKRAARRWSHRLHCAVNVCGGVVARIVGKPRAECPRSRHHLVPVAYRHIAPSCEPSLADVTGFNRVGLGGLLCPCRVGRACHPGAIIVRACPFGCNLKDSFQLQQVTRSFLT